MLMVRAPRDPPEPAAPSVRGRRARCGSRSARAFWALMAPVVLFGGLFSGIFTPTEAAAVAVTYALVLGLVRLPRVPPRRPAAAHPRHRRDHRRRDGAGDDRVAAGLLHLGVAAAAGVRRDADGADDESARLPADRQRAAARRRLLHGGAGGDAGADSDPRAAGAGARHRPGAVRPRVRAQPDDRHDHAAGGRRALRDRQGRGRAVRAHRRAPSLPYPGAAARGARADHAVAAADDVAARLLLGR